MWHMINRAQLVVGGALCVEMDLTRTFQASTKCNNRNSVWNHPYQVLVVLKHHRRLWANIFDTDISRSINTQNKSKYNLLIRRSMALDMFASYIFAHRRSYGSSNLPNPNENNFTLFILLHLVESWNVCVKSISIHSDCDY